MRLIDADALERYLMGLTIVSPEVMNYANAVAVALAAAPTIDAEPVVRCRECKEYKLDCGYCDYWETSRRVDDYCSRGAKMDGGAEE